MSSWATTQQAAAHWPDSAALSAVRLAQLLTAATRDVRSYARQADWRYLTPVALTAASTAWTTTDVIPLAPVTDDQPLALAAVAGQLPADVTVATVAVNGLSGTFSAAALLTAPAATLTLVPTSLMLATVYQAREVYAASVRDGDLIGAGDLAVRARPLTGTVKQLIRPAGPPIGVA